MSTATLRAVRDSKHTGRFTRIQVDRAIRRVEEKGYHPVRSKGSSGAKSRGATSRAKH